MAVAVHWLWGLAWPGGAMGCPGLGADSSARSRWPWEGGLFWDRSPQEQVQRASLGRQFTWGVSLTVRCPSGYSALAGRGHTLAK